MRILNWIELQIDKYFAYKLEVRKCLSCITLKEENELLRNELSRYLKNEVIETAPLAEELVEDDIDMNDMQQIKPARTFRNIKQQLTRNRFEFEIARDNNNTKRMRELEEEFAAFNKH